MAYIDDIYDNGRDPESQGWLAGMLGYSPHENPYTFGTDDYDAWQKGFREGEEEAKD